MTAFINHFTFEFRTGIRNRQLLLMNYLFPLGFYFMMGAIFPSINEPFRETLIPAMVTFGVLAAAFLGIPDPLVSARDKGIFRSYRINGIPATSILAVPAITTTVHLTIVMLIMVITAPLLFDAPAPVNWAGFIGTFAATAFACVGISVLIGVFSSSTRMTVLWSQVVFIPSMLLGGLMMPYEWLPEEAQAFARLLPATHTMNAFNGLAMDKAAVFDPTGSLIILLAQGLLGFGLALYLFSWDSQNNARRGQVWLAALVLLPSIISIFVL